MAKLQQAQYELLKRKLQTDFVPCLPTIENSGKSVGEVATKNLSRAFSAFVLQQLCGISANVAAQAVVDDFDDKGIDAVFYSAPTETLYLIQSKVKQSEQFSQKEALAFCQGIRKLIQQDLTGFNKHVQEREIEIQGAIENCQHIQLVVAHIGDGVSVHAQEAINELLTDAMHGENRFCSTYLDYNAERVVSDLQEAKAPPRVNEHVHIHKHTSINSPRITHFGLINLLNLVELYKKHDLLLYENRLNAFKDWLAF